MSPAIKCIREAKLLFLFPYEIFIIIKHYYHDGLIKIHVHQSYMGKGVKTIRQMVGFLISLHVYIFKQATSWGVPYSTLTHEAIMALCYIQTEEYLK